MPPIIETQGLTKWYGKSRGIVGVDLIVEREQDILAIEIKYARKVDPKDLSGLTVFQGLATKKVVPILVYRGDQIQKRGDVRILPYTAFLNGLLDESL